MNEPTLGDIINAITPLGLLTLVVYLGYRLINRMVDLGEAYLERIVSQIDRYLDIIDPGPDG